MKTESRLQPYMKTESRLRTQLHTLCMNLEPGFSFHKSCSRFFASQVLRPKFLLLPARCLLLHLKVSKNLSMRKCSIRMQFGHYLFNINSDWGKQIGGLIYATSSLTLACFMLSDGCHAMTSSDHCFF